MGVYEGCKEGFLFKFFKVTVRFI